MTTRSGKLKTIAEAMGFEFQNSRLLGPHCRVARRDWFFWDPYNDVAQALEILGHFKGAIRIYRDDNGRWLCEIIPIAKVSQVAFVWNSANWHATLQAAIVEAAWEGYRRREMTPEEFAKQVDDFRDRVLGNYPGADNIWFFISDVEGLIEEWKSSCQEGGGTNGPNKKREE